MHRCADMFGKGLHGSTCVIVSHALNDHLVVITSMPLSSTAIRPALGVNCTIRWSAIH